MQDLAARVAALSPAAREQLAKRARAMAAAPVLRRRDRSRAEPYALSPGQRRLWEARIGRRSASPSGGAPPGAGSWEIDSDVVCQAVHLRGPLDPDRLVDAFRQLIDRHDALRTVVDVVDGEPVAQAGPQAAHCVQRITLPSAADAHPYARELARQPFDLENGPLLRIAVADVAPVAGSTAGQNDHWLLFAADNLIVDAWSFEVLLDELDLLYRAVSGTGVDLPEPPVQFADFAAWQQTWCDSTAGRRAAAYWAEVVADPPPPLPTDRPRDGGPRTLSGRRLDFALPAEVTRRLTAAGRAAGATPFMVYCAVLWATLTEYTTHDDVLIGVFSANRSAPETAALVGYLLNVMPLRLRGGDGSFADRLARVRPAVLEGQRHGAYPAERVARGHLRGLAGAHPLFDVAFVYDSLGARQRRIGDAVVTTADVDRGVARYDLTVAVYDEPGHLHGWVEFNADLLDETTAAGLARRFVEIAADCAGTSPEVTA